MLLVFTTNLIIIYYYGCVHSFIKLGAMKCTSLNETKSHKRPDIYSKNASTDVSDVQNISSFYDPDKKFKEVKMNG